MHPSLAHGAAPSHGAGGFFGTSQSDPPGVSPHGIHAHFPGYTHHQGQDPRQDPRQRLYLPPLQDSPYAMQPSLATGMAQPIPTESSHLTFPPRTPTAPFQSSLHETSNAGGLTDQAADALNNTEGEDGACEGASDNLPGVPPRDADQKERDLVAELFKQFVATTQASAHDASETRKRA